VVVFLWACPRIASRHAEHLEDNEQRASRFSLAKEQMVGLAVVLSSDQPAQLAQKKKKRSQYHL